MKLTLTDKSIRVTVNEDENRVFTFNPHDVSFITRFMALLGVVEEKEAEIDHRLKEIVKLTEVDSYGIPRAVKEAAKLTEEACLFLRGQIDNVFGAGTSAAAFGDANDPHAFSQFIVEIGRVVQEARAQEMEKYTAPIADGVLR